MINYKELQCGNIVRKSASDKPLIVDPDLMVKIKLMPHIYYPFEINEELLLKYGFLEHSIESIHFYFDRIDINLKLKAIAFNGELFKWPEYFHQLQNVVFLLTGKELNIVEK